QRGCLDSAYLGDERGSAVGPVETDAWQHVRIAQRVVAEVAVLRSDGRGKPARRGEHRLPRTARRRIPMRVGEVANGALNEFLKIGPIAAHFETGRLALERSERGVGGRMSADRCQGIAGQAP